MSDSTPQTVTVNLPGNAYNIHIGAGTLAQLGDTLKPLASNDRAMVFADANTVHDAYGQTARQSLADAGLDAQLTPVAISEATKRIDTVQSLYAPLLAHQMERRSTVVSLGGGVLGDTVGFVAASYLRGVPFVQSPTTLLSMVDASVGGKVGVNLPEGKNLVGAFHQPVAVCIDVNTLDTLPDRELRCGLAECIKHAAIRDPRKLDWLSDHANAILERDPQALIELVKWNVAIKAGVVVEDEKESGVRAHLNFGHTFGHAIEATTGYGSNEADGNTSYHHGEAVALGMVAAARLSCDLGLLKPQDADRLIALIDQVGLPVASNALPPTDTLMDAMTRDKKVIDGRVRLVLLDGLGTAVIHDAAEPQQVIQGWSSLSASI